MFTPQKRLWSRTPRSESGQKNNGSVSGPGSGLNLINALSPRSGEGSAKVKDVGFLQGDEQTMLTERFSKLENELFEYQYNMGLLLIEKKEWNSKYEELTQALADITNDLKRERTAHLSSISEVEKKEEDLKKALGVERQCVLDLEKALREMRSEYAEIKFNADSKLAEANSLVTSVEEKSLEVEVKFHAADAKLAEVSRKSSELERNLLELESQENALRRDRSLFTSEREMHDASLSKQREDLREWELKLKEAEERLAEGRRLLNQREEKANDNDKLLNEKQSDLDELKRKIEIGNSTLRSMEEEMSSRLASLALKEKEADDVRKKLEEKENQLLELEEKLNTREKLEIQKLLDEHNSILDKKKQEFELEMEQKRKSDDEQLRNKEVEVEKKESEIKHMEEKVRKCEQAVEKKSEILREKETDLDSKSKALKEKEKSLKVEEKNLEKEKKQMLAEKGDLLSRKAELENLTAHSESMQLKLSEAREQLQITEDERTEFVRLQSELKHEIEKYKSQNEQLMKEADDLKQEKEKFEREWDDLDDRRAEFKKEQEDFILQKSRLEKLKISEEERLRNEKLEAQQSVQRDLEALNLAKDSFAATMEHEKSLLAEKLQSEEARLIHDFEMRKQELEAELHRKQEEAESSLQEKEKMFEQEKEKQLDNINYLREVARREMEDIKLERLRREKEQMEILENKKHIEVQQSEMKNDIEDLVSLSRRLKDQREQLFKERERFIAFAEKQKNCDICGEAIREFMLSDLNPLMDPENLEEAPPLPIAAENYLKEAQRFNAESSPLVNSGSPVAGGTISWLKKCTSKILKFSPGKKLELDFGQDHPKGETLVNQDLANTLETSAHGEKKAELYSKIVTNSSEVRIIESDSTIREVEAAQVLSVDHDSHNTDLKARVGGPRKQGRTRVRRTRQVKEAVIADSETNGDVETSVYTNDERAEESPKNRRKRSHKALGSQATVSENLTEGHSDSIKDGDRPKRKQKVVAAEQSFGQNRYNLRQPKKSVGTVANGSLPKARKGKGKKTDQPQSENLASREEIKEPDHRRFGGESGEDHVRSTAATNEFSADSPFKNAAGHVDTTNTYAEEVNETAEGHTECSFKTESQGEEEEDDDDEVNHPGEASVGKKLWTFLTT